MAVRIISNTQKKIIWSIAKKQLGIGSDELYAAIFGMFEVERMSALTFAQAELFITELRRRAAGLGPDRLTEPQYKKIMAMTRKFGWTPVGLRDWLRRVAGADDVRWLTVAQARDVITGLEKISTYNEKHAKAGELNGL
ncbi:MAG: regulatory protein GemA [Synergistaceae bacterium]|jgi:hypothetical protein|nr:regulatory protein GemA [Synergistaceae bacterium]